MSLTTAGRSAVTADRIREDILSGHFAAGAPLREISLAQRYSVSRRTVREALLDLTSEGLVSHRHNAGAVVKTLELADIEDLYRVRRMLECEGALCASRTSEAALAAVESAFKRFEISSQQGVDSVALAQADMAFHGSIIALAGSPRTDRFYASIGSQMTFAISLLQKVDAANEVGPMTVVAEHRAIKDALLDRNTDEAQRLILAHIGTHEQTLCSLFAQAPLRGPLKVPRDNR